MKPGMHRRMPGLKSFGFSLILVQAHNFITVKF